MVLISYTSANAQLDSAKKTAVVEAGGSSATTTAVGHASISPVTPVRAVRATVAKPVAATKPLLKSKAKTAAQAAGDNDGPRAGTMEHMVVESAEAKAAKRELISDPNNRAHIALMCPSMLHTYGGDLYRMNM